ncbi:MAG: enoyl-CoA hydratase-related protein [Myxococcales bacterium]|nr:enoyl-CoA hydratase-related protein [Myxococcales bacterium]
MIELERQGDVYILHMRGGENRFNPESLAAINEKLDEVEASEGPAALVTTGEGKFYSNGLDLDRMTSEPDVTGAIIDGTHALFGRLLGFPMYTVAACNGHTFAAGAMLALAHDERIMRSDRGWFCLPEVDIGMNFTPLMSALIVARLPRLTAHRAMTTGKRYTAPEAIEAQIALEAVGESEVLARAVALAQPMAAKDRKMIGEVKRRIYADVLALLED